MGIHRFRARWVLPITAPPIHEGEVIVEDDRIVEVRPSSGPPTPHTSRLAPDCVDFGDAVLMSGLVNVHAHIDYTVMRGLLEDLPFFTWIRELTARKEALDEADWISSATMGAAEAVAGGVTTLGDCTDSAAAMLGAKALGLRGIIYQEVFSLDEAESIESMIGELSLKLNALRWSATSTRLRVGVSPHAPYTVRPAAFRALAEFARTENLSVCIHAAESQAESELIRRGSGEIADRFAARNIGWHKPPAAMSTVAYLDSFGAIDEHTLLVHGVQVSAGDREIISRTNAAWAHCPKSNAKLGNGIAPLALFRPCYLDGCPRIGLGSDSVASNNTMDLFEEMRFAVLAQRARKHSHEAMTALEALEMATIGGARALGMDKDVGSLEPGKQADLIAVRLDSLQAIPGYNPVNALVYAGTARDVAMTMIGGEIVYQDGQFLTCDLKPARVRFTEAARKMADWSGHS